MIVFNRAPFVAGRQASWAFYRLQKRRTSKKLESLQRRRYDAGRSRRTSPTAATRNPPMDITIFHNPRCGTSRMTLTLICEAGHVPTVVDCLATPPEREQLAQMIARAGLTVREAARSKESLFAELGLDDPATGDAALLDAMLAHPILINRPFVVTPKGVRLCRPAERVHEIL
jgi:arsenate reductase